MPGLKRRKRKRVSPDPSSPNVASGSGEVPTGGGGGPRSLGQTRVAVAIVRFVGHSCVGKNGQIRLGGCCLSV